MSSLSSRLCECAQHIASNQVIPHQLQIEYAEMAEVERQSEIALRKCITLIGDDPFADRIPARLQALKMTTAEGLSTHFLEKEVILERALAKLELTVT